MNKYLLAPLLLLVAAACSNKQETPVATNPDAAQAPGVNQAAEASVDSPESELLAGSHWRLVEFQSMDDATGVMRPADPSLYTLQLNADGSANMVLNCNRSNGSWSIKPAADGQSGEFNFGPMATTKALCPPPSMDEQISSQSQYIRSFLLKDGRLHLSLMADGGIYVWEPHITETVQVDSELSSAILSAFPDYAKNLAAGTDAMPHGRYSSRRFDLNSDGNDEVLVYLMGPFFCGSGGCTLLLFEKTQAGYVLLNKIGLSRPPVIVSKQSTNGWRDFWHLQSGGGGPSQYVKFSYVQGHYAETARIANRPEGEMVFSENTNFEDGMEL